MDDYIGRLVKQFESDNKGSLAFSQCGNDWGISCGSYQMILRWGICIAFLKKYFPVLAKLLYFNGKKDIKTPKYPGVEYCSSPEEVKKVWLACYNSVGADKFFQFEHEYIKSLYYDPLLKQSPIQPTNRAMQECFWSWAVHKGVSGALTGLKEIRNSSNKLFDAIYDYRYKVNPFARYGTGSASEREVLRPYLNQPIFKEGDSLSNYKKIFTVGEFMKKLYEVCNQKTVYVFGSVGEPVTAELIDRKAKEQPKWYTPERIKNLKSLSSKGYYGFDCSNLLKALFWGWTGTKLSNNVYTIYQSNTVPDKNADGLFAMCMPTSSDLSTIEVGEVLWFSGHIGVYAGNGNVIDCTPSLNKVYVNPMNRQKWLMHGKLPWIDYTKNTDINVTKSDDSDQVKFIKEIQKILGMEQTGRATTALLDKTVTISATTNKNHALVTPLERYMKALGYYSGTIEADLGKAPAFGSGITTAVKKYQKEVVKATVANQDGIITKSGATWKKLLNI